MPPFLRRMLIVVALLPGVGMFVFFMVPQVIFHRQKTAIIWMITMPAYFLYCAVFGLFAYRWKARFRRRLHAARCLLCWHCGYDLSGLGAEGICPECGRTFAATQLQAEWLSAGYCTYKDWETTDGSAATEGGPPVLPR